MTGPEAAGSFSESPAYNAGDPVSVSGFHRIVTAESVPMIEPRRIPV